MSSTSTRSPTRPWWVWTGPVLIKIAASALILVFIMFPPWNSLMPWTLVALLLYLALSTNLEMLLIWRGKLRHMFRAHVAALAIGALAATLYVWRESVRQISLTEYAEVDTGMDTRLPYGALCMGGWFYVIAVLVSLAVAARWPVTSDAPRADGPQIDSAGE